MTAELEQLLRDVDAAPGSTRAQLVQELLEEGAGRDKICSAYQEGRLSLLPLERVLAEEGKHTLSEIADANQLDLEAVVKSRKALGLSVEVEKPVHGAVMEQHAQRLAAAIRAGLPLSEIVALNRVIGRGMASIASACRDATVVLLEDAESESQRALQAAQTAEALAPIVKQVLTDAFDGHLRELVKQEASAALLAAGTRLPAHEIAVAFVDAVGFTRMGQRLPPQRLAGVAEVLEQETEDVLRTDVQFVKSIGDAVMLASASADELVDTVVDLLRRAAADDNDLPALHAGAAWGPATARGGDWYGRTVTLASRLSDFASPGTLVVDHPLASVLDEPGRFRKLDRIELKGFDEPVSVHALAPEDPA